MTLGIAIPTSIACKIEQKLSASVSEVPERVSAKKTRWNPYGDDDKGKKLSWSVCYGASTELTTVVNTLLDPEAAQELVVNWSGWKKENPEDSGIVVPMEEAGSQTVAASSSGTVRAWEFNFWEIGAWLGQLAVVVTSWPGGIPKPLDWADVTFGFDCLNNAEVLDNDIWLLDVIGLAFDLGFTAFSGRRFRRAGRWEPAVASIFGILQFVLVLRLHHLEIEEAEKAEKAKRDDKQPELLKYMANLKLWQGLAGSIPGVTAFALLPCITEALAEWNVLGYMIIEGACGAADAGIAVAMGAEGLIDPPVPD
jgi:hypothetical protein